MSRTHRGKFRLGAVALLGVAPLLAASAVAAPASLAGGTPRTTAGADCRSSINPYKASAAQLSSCGDQVYPLEAVRALSGGGRTYVYDVGGVTVSIPVAPSGFDPVNATAAQLQRYGFPPRPSRGQALLSWLYSMRKAHETEPPRYLVTGPASDGMGCIGPGCKAPWPFWAGNVATSHTYSDVYGYWLEPSIATADCATPQEEGTWAGLGGAKTAIIVQAGTQYGAGGKAHQGWAELINGASNKLIWSSVTATVGGEFNVNIDHSGGSYSIYLENDYTGAHQTLNESWAYDGSTAEFIVEDPNGGDYPPSTVYLVRFGTFEVQDAEASDNGGSVYHGLANWAHTDYVMKSPLTGNTMAYAGAAFNSGDSWYDYHENCS